MQFLLLFSLNTLLALFQFDGWRADIEQPQTKQEALCVGPTLAIKVILEGPYTSAGAGNVKMNSSLKTRLATIANTAPNTGSMPEPYTTSSPGFGLTAYGGGGGNMALSTIFAGTATSPTGIVNYNTGDNAIVDWVFIQLRDPTTPTTIVATQSALLQADGDVVNVDGESPVTFNKATYTALDCGQSYHVAILHRNHLGIRTLNALQLTNTAVPIDFTNSLEPVLGTNARKTLSNGTLVLYSGDANRSGSVTATDINLFWTLQLPVSYNYFTSSADFNLNGSVTATDNNLFWYTNTGRTSQTTARF